MKNRDAFDIVVKMHFLVLFINVIFELGQNLILMNSYQQGK